MLALVTCHIFPPQSDTEKKWIPGTWLPGWQLAVFQSPRLHECGPADAHGNAQPFCMDKCIFRKKTPVLQFGHTLEQNSSICPIISYLWMVDLVMRRFSCGASLWRPSTRIRPKKGPGPLDFIFDTCASASSSHLFLVGEAEHMWLYPLLQGQMYFQKKKKTVFCNLGALTQNSWIRPIMSYLWMIGLVMRLFSCGPTFEDHPQEFGQKKVQPLGFYFWHLRLGLFKSPFFWLVKLNICGCTPFARTNVFSEKKKKRVLQFGRVDTKFLNSSHHVLSVDDWPGDATFFPVGQPLKIIRKYSVKKGPVPWILFLTPAPWPLEVTFLVGEGEHMRLYPFAKSCKESYPLN